MADENDYFTTWVEQVVDAMLERALQTDPKIHRDLFREVLYAKMRPALDKHRTAIFFGWGSRPENFQPAKFVDILLSEVDAMNARGREPTQPIPPEEETPLPPPLPGLNASTLVDYVIELSEKDLLKE